MRFYVPRCFCIVFAAMVFLLSSSLHSGIGRAAERGADLLASVAANGKLVSSGNAVAALKGGQESARFIVMLAEPATTKKGASLASESAKAERRGQVAAVLDGFLNRKKAADTGDVTRRFSYMPAFAATLTAVQLQGLLADEAVAFIREDRMNKPQLRQGIPLMGASATRSEFSGKGVAVAIADTGVDYNNTYLGAAPLASNTKVIGGYDVGLSKADPMDADGHGTACAGIVAGTIGNTGDYIGGVAPDAKIYALKITDATGDASDSAIMAAGEWCVTHQNDDSENPIMIINISFGGERYTSNCDASMPDYAAAVNNILAAGITVFASSGNDGYCNAMGSPACLSGIVSVGAVYDADFGEYTPCVEPESCVTKIADAGCDSGYYTEDATAADKVAAYSDAASFLTLLAPSNQCYTLQCAAQGSTFNTAFGGTSAASPYAAGAAAALQSAAKEERGEFLTPAQVKSLLVGTGRPITDTKAAVTKPRVNLQAAIDRMLGRNATAPQGLLLLGE
ncbi:S8 family peptidase [Desulfolutivibrio sp.]|uniref:S8 family peptidase n=1 Tax=Desulfolutivibrio sp. TaxID=2773296 RepID=UPI002F96A5BD